MTSEYIILSNSYQNNNQFYKYLSMSLKINLEEIKKGEFQQSITAGNYRNIEIYTTTHIQKLSAFLLPIIAILKQYPLIDVQLIPQKLNQPQADVVALGGTFDYLHIGHDILLVYAIQLAKKQIIVGVTGDQLLKNKKNKEIIQPISQRMKNVEEYIRKIKPELIITIAQLKDPFGPTITRQDINAIVVSQETIKGGQKINQIRGQKGFHLLTMHTCPMISPTSQENIADKLSSSQIRNYILFQNQFNIEQFNEYKQFWQNLHIKIHKYLNCFPQNNGDFIRNKWLTIVLKQYSEYWRHYHVNRHIYDMLKQFNNLWATNQQLNDEQKLIIEIAIWFHDVQYIPKDQNNEQKSAETAQRFLKEFEEILINKQDNKNYENLIQAVKSAIISTKNHSTQVYHEKILIDIDMSILNSPKQRYMKYADQIRKEYYPIAKDKFAEKRLQFLKNLDLSKVFYLIQEPINLKSNIEAQILSLSQQIELQKTQNAGNQDL